MKQTSVNTNCLLIKVYKRLNQAFCWRPNVNQLKLCPIITQSNGFYGVHKNQRFHEISSTSTVFTQQQQLDRSCILVSILLQLLLQLSGVFLLSARSSPHPTFPGLRPLCSKAKCQEKCKQVPGDRLLSNCAADASTACSTHWRRFEYFPVLGEDFGHPLPT